MPLQHRPTLLALALAALAGCSALTPAGLFAARNLDPLNTRPVDIVFAVGVPAMLQLEDGDAEFRLAFQADDGGTPIRKQASVPLQISPATADVVAPTDENEVVYIAQIAPSDAPAIFALQSEIKGLRAQGIQGEGSLTVDVIGGCFLSSRPETLSVSTWLRTSPDAEFVKLTRRQSLSGSIGQTAADALLARLEPCAG